MRIKAKKTMWGQEARETEVSYGEVLISLLIPVSIWRLCKEKGWHYREIFCSGVQTYSGLPAVSDELNELRQGNMKLQNKLTIMQHEIDRMRN